MKEFNLERFVSAQQGKIEDALSELREGEKTSHWMWFIFPQISGLGESEMSRRYAIGSIEEAEAYLRHEVLGPRLVECFEAVLAVEGKRARQIFGRTDEMKLRSSATLFAEASGAGSIYEAVLRKYFDGSPDPMTLEILRSDRAR